jgi:hypothetical protein
MGLSFQSLTGETHKKSLQPQATHTQQAAFDRQGQAKLPLETVLAPLNKNDNDDSL